MTKRQREKNKQAVSNKDCKVEVILGKTHWSKGYLNCKNDKTLFEILDFTFKDLRVLFFFALNFGKGRIGKTSKYYHKTNMEFWQERNYGA